MQEFLRPLPTLNLLRTFCYTQYTMNYINIWSVVVGAISSMVIGSIYYGPLFGKRYMDAIGMNEWSPEKRERMTKNMGLTYGAQFIASMVTFYVLAGVIIWFDKTSAMGGASAAFWMWLGFILPVKIGDALWGGTKELFWLGAGNTLVTMLVGGAILGAMN